MPQATPEARRRTRAFARVLGPFVAAATVIIAIRLPDLTGLLGGLFDNAVLPWILGAAMLMMGLVVIAFHQYWYSVTAVLISLFGWFVALRGLAMMAIPSAIDSGANATVTSPGPLLAARIFFLLLTAMGLWLTYVGWRRDRTPDDSAVTV
ncbi:hypothetical protein [Mycolicibacterium neworleansense]|uniref:Uncharacterized protein n=1 Tax=Mycolicibacterium neworleansense TaxID=146018 RepID=A0A0H5RYY2_9MYCO|nr:hypothetical protein [Mycolicibacterium neworleansense]MCV7363051.1 hypothetical protein [Mycolicibacterium neworleansense]CRZ13894.1 hypothetical protein BN2156_00737 [Mycolicibacterium neworleansense]